jgi:hypothetical protein
MNALVLSESILNPFQYRHHRCNGLFCHVARYDTIPCIPQDKLCMSGLMYVEVEPQYFFAGFEWDQCKLLRALEVDHQNHLRVGELMH